MDENDGLLTVAETARELGIAIRTVRDRIAAGELPAKRYGERLWLIPRGALAAPGLGKRNPGPKPRPAHD